MNDNTDRSRTETRSTDEEGELRRQLEEVRQTLEAIRHGDVDGLVVVGPRGEQVYSLEGAEHVYRVIVETMNEAALTVDRDGTILFCNRRFCDLMKTSVGAVMGRKATTFVAGPQQKPLESLLSDAMTRPVQRRLTLLAADGTPVPVQFSASLLEAGDRPSVCLVASDLTELEASAQSVHVLREHQQALEESEEKYRRIVEAANEGIWLIDAEDKTTFINEQGARILGYTPGEMLGHSPVEYLYAADQVEGKKRLNARQRGKRAHLDYRMRHKNGSEVWVYSSTISIHDGRTYSGVLAMFSDVTERKRAERALQDANEELLARAEQLQTVNEMLEAQQQETEAANDDLRTQDKELASQSEALREQKERLRLALDAAHMGTWDWDLASGHVLWDDAHYRLLGCKPGRVDPSYQAWARRVHPEDLPAAEAVLRRSMEQCVDYTAEYRVLWPDGTTHWVEARGRFESDDAGRAVRSYGVLLDITDRKQAHEELRQSRARLAWVLETTGIGVWFNELPFGGLNWDEQTRRLFFSPPDVEPTIDLFWGRIHPNDRERTRLAVAEAIRGHTLYDIEHRAVNPGTGEVRWIRSAGRATYAADGASLRFDGINYDITARKRAEEALRDSEERMRSLAENVPCVLMRFDRQLRVVYLNRQSDRYNPNPVEQMIGRTNREMGMPEHLCDLWDAAIERVFRTGVQEELEFDFAGPSGLRTFALKLAPEFGLDHEVQYVLGVSSDITERKQMEGTLREWNATLESKVAARTADLERARRRLYEVLEAIPAMVCLLTPDYQVAFANRSFRQVFGEANGRHCYEFCFGRTQPCEFCQTYEVLKTGRPSRWEVTAVDGRTIIEAHDYPFTDVDGSPLILEMDIDITARKQAEAALRGLNETLSRRARQLQKLTLELTQAEERERRRIAVILHEDLQQQIAGAKFHLSMIRRRATDARMQADIEAIDAVLKSTIELSRSLSRDLSPVVVHMNDLAEVLRWLANRAQAQQGLTVRLEVRGDMMLRSEPLALFLFRAVQEMLFNVVKHAQVPEAAVRVRRIGRWVCLSVSDRGRGFESQELKETSGIGLFSIQERTELLGGRMRVKSDKGKGSRFSIVVPDGS